MTNIIVNNKKALFNYEIVKKIEAGIKLQGSEVKALRQKQVNISESFITIKNNECFIKNLKITNIRSNSLFFTHEERRIRKLLLNRREIIYLNQKVKEDGLTIIPISMYFKDALVKIEIALCRGKKLHDKRQVLKERDVQLRIKKVLKNV